MIVDPDSDKQSVERESGWRRWCSRTMQKLNCNGCKSCFARNIFQAKRTANLQRGIEPPRQPALEQEQDRGIFDLRLSSVWGAYVSYRVLESRCHPIPQQHRRPECCSNSVSNWTRLQRCQTRR